MRAIEQDSAAWANKIPLIEFWNDLSIVKRCFGLCVREDEI